MTNKPIKHFNIRVYGLLLNDNNEVLVTDEFQLDTSMTKFPGGGLDFGEGTIDCLRREMREECQQEIVDIEHFYTTEFFQQALYFDDHQLISIYYLAKLQEPVNFKISNKAFDFEPGQNGNQSFRWLSIEKLNPEEFTFPIDKHVANLLRERFQQ
ncbi:NUDIX hydrolase [Mangrovibacterium lignilyticum]|uniref:NUDIX hydrolase n=1 Tax=Mangrovibacterium lignilyticum TaxID=2668052 RepID=UPI0013D37957|nr:NUDIX hydrolase [Mangrovibacterium lignilyticum]